MCNSGVLIHIETEQPRSKEILLYFLHCFFISLEGVTFITNLRTQYRNSPLSQLVQRFKLGLTVSIGFLYLF